MFALPKALFAAAAIIVAILGSVQTVCGDSIVIPNVLANTEGNSSIRFNPNLRFQQVHAAAEFSSPGGPVSITRIAFRPDGQFGFAFAGAINPYLQVNLSTTGRAPDGLSATFANNIGADEIVAYSGSITFSSGFTGPAGGPKDFDVIINLARPFIYNPAAGNLLMDVRSVGALFGPSGFFTDLQISSSDGVSRVEGRIDSSTGGSNSEAIVTHFTYSPTPVPEPATIVLLSAGLAGAAAKLRNRRKASKGDEA